MVIFALLAMLFIGGIVGYLIGSNTNNPPKYSNSSPSSSSPQPTLPLTNDWIPYTNQKLGISFQYPRVWQRQKDMYMRSTLFVNFNTGNVKEYPQPYLDISREENRDNLTLQSWLKQPDQVNSSSSSTRACPFQSVARECLIISGVKTEDPEVVLLRTDEDVYWINVPSLTKSNPLLLKVLESIRLYPIIDSPTLTP